MKVMDILVKDAVILELAGESKPEVLREVAGALASQRDDLDAEPLTEALIAREELASTGIGDGVAIPHAKVAGLGELLAAFARSPKGVDFASIDGAPTHLFFLLVVPEHSSGPHLKALARISRFLRDDEFRTRLLEAESVEDTLKAIEAEDAKF